MKFCFEKKIQFGILLVVSVGLVPSAFALIPGNLETEKTNFEFDPNDVADLTNKGISFYKSGEFDEAIAYFDKALEIDKKYQDALFSKGITLIQQERYDDSLAYFERVLEINPDYLDAYINKGYAYESQERFDWALGNYDKALEIDPDYLPALNNKAILLYKLERYDDAILVFDRSLEIDPENVDALLGKAFVLFEFVVENPELYNTAEELIWKVLEIDPENSIAKQHFGLTGDGCPTCSPLPPVEFWKLIDEWNPERIFFEFTPPGRLWEWMQEASAEPEESAIYVEKIPEWFKENMQWYLDGKITDKEMTSSIKFLIIKGVIVLD